MRSSPRCGAWVGSCTWRPGSLKLLGSSLEKAKSYPPDADSTDKRHAVSICRDLIALYVQDPDPKVSAFAQEARQFLNSRGWQ